MLVLDISTQPFRRAADSVGMLDDEKLDVYRCATHAVRRWNSRRRSATQRRTRRRLIHRKQLVVRMVEMLTKMCR
ncbi:MAG: hypothetical protein NT062_08695 [Proteobacteria bacterium]|nr:hypothetical protein [Pseudomonadota bacterium]